LLLSLFCLLVRETTLLLLCQKTAHIEESSQSSPTKMKAQTLLFVISLVSAAAQNCNICGDGNTIQFPTGVVEFMYKGAKWKNNCEKLQDIVKNPVAVSDSFCRNELLEYTVDICRCTDPKGELVRTYYEAPTVSPAPGGPPSEKQAESKAEKVDKSSACDSLVQKAMLSLVFALAIGLIC
jgi:hypothetical protein